MNVVLGGGFWGIQDGLPRSCNYEFGVGGQVICVEDFADMAAPGDTMGNTLSSSGMMHSIRTGEPEAIALFIAGATSSFLGDTDSHAAQAFRYFAEVHFVCQDGLGVSVVVKRVCHCLTIPSTWLLIYDLDDVGML